MKLYVKDEEGQYTPATPLQVHKSARESAGSLYKRGMVFSKAERAKEFFAAKLRALPHEVFAVLFLDNRHALIQYEEMFRGTIDGSNVWPREAVKRALELNAAAVVFGHNHPSGISEPSLADKRITTRLIEALALVDIRVLDHIIVGEECCSFAESRLL